MFTGIIRHVGTVKETRPSNAGGRLAVDLGPVAEGLKPGDSVAVNGACLTVSELAGTVGRFDVVSETLARTTLGSLRAGSRVNLEPALRLGDGLDGHLVQGHVDGTAAVSRIDRAGQWKVYFTCPRELLDAMIPKGSVAMDGVSLTLVDVTRDGFSVALIPTTLGETTLADLAVGAKVNIETDLIGKYIRKCLGSLVSSGGLTLEKLRDAGFA